MPIDNRILQFQRAADGGVAREIPANGRYGCFFHVLGGREMRIPRRAIHDFDALLAELFGLCHCGHGGRRFDAADALRKLHGDWGLCYWTHALPAFTFRSANLSAGSSFSLSRCSTNSGTSLLMSPPKRATSRTSRELRYEYF